MKRSKMERLDAVNQITYIAIATAILLVMPALIGIVAGRGDRAIAAARTLALIAAALSAFGGVLVYLGSGPLSRLPNFGGAALLVGGFFLFGLGFVLALTACTLGLTRTVMFREWQELGWLGAALVVLLVAAGLGTYALLGTISYYMQLTTWTTIASGVVALGALLVAAWGMRVGRRSALGGANS